MTLAANLFAKKNNTFRISSLVIIILIVALITFVYYSLQFYRNYIFMLIPFARSFITWEYVYDIVGSLYFIPIIYSIILFRWRGTLIIGLLSIFIILPRMLYFYNGNISRILTNIFFLSIPLLVLIYVNFELRWRDRERRISYEKEKERQNYMTQVFRVQEDERRRVALEIHDDSLQRLASIVIAMELLTNEENLVNIKNRAETIKELVISIAQDLRRISLDLRPLILDDMGLLPAIRWLVDEFKYETNIDARLEIIGDNKSISKTTSINVFRIVQEALSNIKRHSQATNVLITIQLTDKFIKVVIEDNGIGFSVPKTNRELFSKGKIGITGMQQRAQFFGGHLVYHSEKGKGTKILLEANL